MKLSVLLVTLLALSRAFAEDVKDDEKLSEQKDDSDLQADSGDQIPKVRVARAYRFHRNSNLKWQTFYGILPRDTVRIWNRFSHRFDYVCQAYCLQGFYPGKGNYCYYPHGGKERRHSSFQLLVNRDNFELLEWKWQSWGRVPKNAVKGCKRTYVGKNKYGLGLIDPPNKSFYLPWRGREDRYRGYYALVVNMDIVKQGINHVKYYTKKMFVHTNHHPAVLRASTATNYRCSSFTQSVSLTKSVQTEDRWDVTNAVTASVSTTVTAGVPFFGSAETSIGIETSMDMAKGTSKVKSVEHSVSVEVAVPANHECRVEMVAEKYKADLPFKALLIRKYRNGKTTKTWVKGLYKKHQVSEIRAVARRCTKIKGSKPCSK